MLRDMGNYSVTLGVAGIQRKLYSAPMQALLSSLVASNSSIELVLLDESRMNQPVTTWPVVDALLSLYSSDFPLDAVLQYVELRSPLLINNLYMQRFLMDRRDIRAHLARAGVPIPPAVCADRSAGDSITQMGHQGNTLIVHGPRKASGCSLQKPFVEKPVDAEDHSKLLDSPS